MPSSKFITIFATAVVVSFLNLSVGFAAEPLSERDRIIEKTLNCLNAAREEGVQWTDICYTLDREDPVPQGDGRDQVFESDLRRVDRRLKQQQPLEDEAPAVSYRYDRDNSDRPFNLRLDVISGYRIDDFEWNIASDVTGTQTPDILSELKWNDIESWEIKGKGQVIFENGFVLDGILGFSSIFAGDNQDSDYDGDNRTLEYSRSNNSADQGYMLDFEIGFGYQINLLDYIEEPILDELSFTPLLGYAHHSQNFTMTEGFQTIPANGPFGGLDSTYDAQWNGGWIGFELSGAFEAWQSLFRFEYHIADYYAEADWNLRSDFKHPKSYEHESNGDGFSFTGALGYKINPNWSANFWMEFRNWSADPGTDRTFYSDGTIGLTKLNEVNWTSAAFGVGLQYNW